MGKYYTPTLEEIHVGLECEWQSKIRGEAWNKQVFDVDLVSIAYDALEHDNIEEPFSDQFRIKYLDEKDLIELGWIKDGSTFKIIEGYYDEEEDMTGIEYKLTLYVKRLFITKNTISYGEVYRPYEGDNYVFKGQVKNKSEMKKLMSMLNIKLENRLTQTENKNE